MEEFEKAADKEGAIFLKQEKGGIKRIWAEHGFYLTKLFIGVVFVVLAAALPVSEMFSTILYALAALVTGYTLVIEAAENIREGEIFDENLLMIIASVTAFALGEGFEGAIVVLLFGVGEFLEDVATDGSREKIAGLAQYKSVSVNALVDGKIITVLPEDVKTGSIVYVKKGERIPIDGVLESEITELDMKVITGESRLFTVKRGDEVYGGSVNLGNAVEIRTTKEYKDSTVERIISLVEESSDRKSKSEKYITKFAKIYTPAVILVALLIAVVPPFIDQMNFAKWIYKSMSFLVVACPCALVISVPLCFFLGIGTLAKRGVLVKGGNYLETLSNVSVAVFDKTGTLTKGEFTIENVLPENGYDKEFILQVASTLESCSTHPIAKAIVGGFGGKMLKATELKEIAGNGVSGIIDGKEYFVGKENYSDGESAVSVNCEGKKIGVIVLSDELKPESKILIQKLTKQGVNMSVIISGDAQSAVEKAARETGVNKAYYRMSPEEKVNKLAEIISEKKKGRSVMFCGDGVNDSPSIAMADVGVAMGALGSEAAVDNADVVISDDDLLKIPETIRIAKIVKRTSLFNVVGSIGVKLAIMVLSVFIGLPLWVAILGDVGVMLLTVFNSLTIGLRK